MNNSDYVKEYWAGYNACKHDIEYKGIDFAAYKYMHDLKDVTDVYVRGYKAALLKRKI